MTHTFDIETKALHELPQLLSVEETARVLRISKETVWRRLRCGELTRVRNGKRTFIHRAELEPFLSAPPSTRACDLGLFG